MSMLTVMLFFQSAKSVFHLTMARAVSPTGAWSDKLCVYFLGTLIVVKTFAT